jgi:hypothetical protein
VDRKDVQEHVIASQTYLEETGPTAKMPMSYPIKQTNRCAMKELRPASKGRSELRILYAFDFRRKALLLLGGDKAATPGDWASWYDGNVPIADVIFIRMVEQAKKSDEKRVKKPGKR